MKRFLVRFWRWFRAEIVLGFLIATVLWAGVLGWQAANTPTDAEKQKCYEAAEQAHHKTEECKTLWERTTSDPVAFFTLWLVIFTGGLTVSTVMLWRAGEKQAAHARRSAAIQTRDMQASIHAAEKAANAAVLAANSERAWLTASGIEVTESQNTTVDGVMYPTAICLSIRWVNNGRSPAINVGLFGVGEILEQQEAMTVFEIPEWPDQKAIVGPGMTVLTPMQAIAGDNLARFKRREANWLIYSRVNYFTVYEPGVMRHRAMAKSW